MRFLPFAIAGLLICAPAVAETIPDATLAAISEAATAGYADPGAAEVINVRKSLARNGSGYCGEVSEDGAAGTFTVFHVVLETGSGVPSVIRLADFPEAGTQRDTVTTLLTNFGCTN